MKRIFAAIAASFALLAVSAPAALAKGPGWEPPQYSVSIAGPGLAATIELEGKDAKSMLYVTTFLGYGFQPPSPPKRLGPAYQVLYFVEMGDEPGRVLRQEIYPYTPGAVWAWTPKGQDMAGFRVAGNEEPGRWLYSTTLFDRLVEAGLPPKAPASREERSSPEPAGSMTILWVGLAVVALVAGGAAVHRRRIQPAH